MGVTWAYIAELTFDTINVLYFLNPDTGWAATKTGMIYKTTTGGIKWFEIPNYNNQEIIKLRFFTDSTGYFISRYAKFIVYRYYLYRTVTGPWAIEDKLQDRTLRICPNPAQSKLNLYVTDQIPEINSFEIVSITGKVVFRSPEFINKIDVSGYEEGIYLLRYESNGAYNSIKFIICR